MTRHRFHGDPHRFGVVADFVTERFPAVRYVADVGGGQGMLARLLGKKHQLECEVVDPRGWTLKGVPSRPQEYTADLADFYDLIIGLHPDEALVEVVSSARIRPTVVVPCCNFWDRGRRLGRDDLLTAITGHHQGLGGQVEPVTFDFTGPKNLGLVLLPPEQPGSP